MMFTGLLIYLCLIIIRPQDFIEIVQGARLVFICMSICLIIWVASPRNKELIKTDHDKYMAMLVVMMFVSSFATLWPSYILYELIESIKFAMIYVFIVTTVDTYRKIRIMTTTIIVCLAGVEIISILQYHGINLTGVPMLWQTDKQAWLIQGVGIFNNPNDIAYSVMIIIPFALRLLLGKGSAINRVIGLVLGIMTGYCIAITHSRGGYLASFVCIAAWLYLWSERWMVKRITLAMGIMGALICLSILAGGYRQDKSAMGRVDSWGEGMSMLKSNPVIGVGKGQFLEHHNVDSHNSFVRAGAEMGILGLYAFCGLLFVSIKSMMPDRGFSDAYLNIIKSDYLAYLLAFIVGSLISTRTYDALFYTIVALSGSLIRISAGSTAVPLIPLFNKSVVCVVIVVLIFWKLFLYLTW